MTVQSAFRNFLGEKQYNIITVRQQENLQREAAEEAAKRMLLLQQREAAEFQINLNKKVALLQPMLAGIKAVKIHTRNVCTISIVPFGKFIALQLTNSRSKYPPERWLFDISQAYSEIPKKIEALRKAGRLQ